MDGVLFLIPDRPHFVNRLTDNVHDATKSFGANRGTDLLAGIDNDLATFEAVGGVHGDSADRVLTEVLSNLQYQIVFTVINGRICHAQCVVDLRQLAGLKFNVDNGADDLRNFTCVLTHGTVSSCGRAASYSVTYLELAFDRFGAGDDFHQLRSNGSLTCPVVLKGQFADHFVGVLRCAVHGGHTGTMFTSHGLEHRFKNLNFDVFRQDLRQQFTNRWFIDELDRSFIRSGALFRNNRQHLLEGDVLCHDRTEGVIEQFDLIILFCHKTIDNFLSKRDCCLIIRFCKDISKVLVNRVSAFEEFITFTANSHDADLLVCSRFFLDITISSLAQVGIKTAAKTPVRCEYYQKEFFCLALFKQRVKITLKVCRQ